MKKQSAILILLVSVCCLVMLAVDGIWQPGYWIKSSVKILLFLASPIIYGVIFQTPVIRNMVRTSRSCLATPLLLAAAVYAVIVAVFFLLRGTVDFSSVLSNLPEGVTKTTFPFVALYISFINSLLEEVFFRGFAYLSLSKSTKGASLFSAVAFALYHTAMMLGWFPLPVFLLALIGLTAGGMIFNYLCKKSENIIAGWLVHMFANFAINTIGLLLFFGLV